LSSNQLHARAMDHGCELNLAGSGSAGSANHWENCWPSPSGCHAHGNYPKQWVHPAGAQSTRHTSA